MNQESLQFAHYLHSFVLQLDCMCKNNAKVYFKCVKHNLTICNHHPTDERGLTRLGSGAAGTSSLNHKLNLGRWVCFNDQDRAIFGAGWGEGGAKNKYNRVPVFSGPFRSASLGPASSWDEGVL